MPAPEILLINDGSRLLNMMGVLLAHQGYRLHLTDSPEEGLELLSSRRLRLVVIKINGRDTPRLALLHLVREMQAGARLIILGEAAGLPADIFEIEADDYLLLPCRVAEIRRRLLAALTSAPAPAAPTREDDVPHPVNQRVLHNLKRLFHDLRERLTSMDEGLSTLRRRTRGRPAGELEDLFQDLRRHSRTLIRMTEAFLEKVEDRPQARPAAKLVDLWPQTADPCLTERQEEMR